MDPYITHLPYWADWKPVAAVSQQHSSSGLLREVPLPLSADCGRLTGNQECDLKAVGMIV